MNPYEEKTKVFHEAFDIKVDADFSVELLELRKNLLTEEMKELIQEIDISISEINEKGCLNKETKMNLLKEMADVQCALSGTAVTFGFPVDKAFDRVMESNMSKLDENGKPIHRADGKVLKGPNYKSAFLEDLVE